MQAFDEHHVSIITPTFQRAAFLLETLRSIRQQTQGAIEHIIVDDGSTDNTAELVAQFAAEKGRDDCEIVYIYQANSGEAAAINAGWRAARGQFVAVVNSDDPQPPDWLAVCVAALHARPAAVVAYPSWEVIDAAGHANQRVEAQPYSRATMIAEVSCLPGPGAVIRKALVPDIELRRPDLRYLSDYECWLRLSLRGEFLGVPHALARWREHESGTSATMDRRLWCRELFAVLDDFFARDLPADIASMRRASVVSASYQCFRMLWRTYPFHAAVYGLQGMPAIAERLLRRS